MSNATLREALQRLVFRIDARAAYGSVETDELEDVMVPARAALAADDAERGTMQLTGDQARAIAQSVATSASDPVSPMEYVRAGWQAASRAAAPQSVEPPQTTEHTVRDANQKEHMDKIEQSMLTQAIEGRERIWTCKLGGKISGLPKGADGPMRRAAQECFARMTGYEAEFCFSGWGGELTESERAVVENRLPQHPTAPTDAEWQEEAMRLAEDYAGAHCVQWGDEPDEAEVSDAKEALRAHIATRPLPAPPTKKENGA